MKAKNFFRKFFKSLSYYFVIVITLVNTGLATPSFAKGGDLHLPKGRETEFAENNIIFYNPEGREKNKCSRTGTGECGIFGNSYEERMWSGLRNYGFTPEQTAGLLGNFLHEGSSPIRQEDSYIRARNNNCKTQEGKEYSIWLDGYGQINGHPEAPPATHDSCMESHSSGNYKKGGKVAGIGLGFAQWTSHEIRAKYLSLIESAGLIDYLDGDAYKTWGTYNDNQLRENIIAETGSDSDWYALWCVALGYIYDTFSNNSGFLANSTPEDYAGWVSANYERCLYCAVGQSSYEARRKTAREIYDKYLAGAFDEAESHLGETRENNDENEGENKTTSNTIQSEEDEIEDGEEGNKKSTETGANVTLIGDSISVRSESEIKALLPDLTDFDAKSGRKFDEGVDIASGKSLKKIVVFALGSNGGANEEQVNKLLSHATNSTVIFVTNYSRGKYDYTANNALFKSKLSTQVKIADWAAAVSSDPEKYIAVESDGVDVHPTVDAGTKKFAKVIYDAVKGSGSGYDSECDDTYGNLPSGGFQSVEEADNAIMKAYRAIYPRDYGVSDEGDAWLTKWHIHNADSACQSDLENCPSFVAYFIQKYLGVKLSGELWNGGQVATQLKDHYGFKETENGGHTPKVYSVFSRDNHTGVVLGINNDTKQIIVGEAGCGNSISWSAAHPYDFSKISSWYFVYKP